MEINDLVLPVSSVSFEMSTAIIEVERALRLKSEEFSLRSNESAKADIWAHFSLIYENNSTTSSIPTQNSFVVEEISL